MSSWAVSKKRFQRDLLAWFALEGRDFPWRHRTDAYSILIAEKLLQQTVARRALVEAYDQILKQYPDPSALSSAKVRDLKKIIRPLGFSYRAKELIMLAHTLVSKYGGKVPTSLRDLMTLPGVGDYSARAVLSFAYGEDVPVVDTNVARFLYRLYGLQGPMPKIQPGRRA